MRLGRVGDVQVIVKTKDISWDRRCKVPHKLLVVRATNTLINHPTCEDSTKMEDSLVLHIH